MMEPRISLVTLGVDDLDRAVAFYRALGWPAPQRPDAEVAFFQAGGMVFALWTGVQGRGAPGVELAYNVRAPEDVALVLDAAVAAGGSLVRPAERAEWGGIGSVRGPGGVCLGGRTQPGLADRRGRHRPDVTVPSSAGDPRQQVVPSAGTVPSIR